ncbi:MAG TPA: hypothetical protein VGP93_10125, partial [Polyangiaceae bacterium]|nr:hypothetical protein [Polyangiaceae bacterium]
MQILSAMVGRQYLFAYALALSACGGEPALDGARDAQPEGWADELGLPQAEDLNPDPAIVELNLEAKSATLELLPGVSTPVWTYNGKL